MTKKPSEKVLDETQTGLFIRERKA